MIYLLTLRYKTKKMKTKLLLLLAITFGLTVQAQDGYTFTLTQNSGYNYSVKAVANYNSVMGMDPDLESFGFAIMLQDGASIDQSSLVLPYGSLDGGTIFINTAATLDGADPGNDRSSNYIAISSGSNLGFPGHSAGDEITIATFDILGSPTTGEISILDNASGLASLAFGSLDSFINADTTGGNTATAVYQGQSGTTSYSFATLTVEVNELTGYSIFPNPATNVVNIKGLENTLSKVEVFNIAGQRVYNSVSNMETINVGTFNAGVYFVKLSTEDASITTKLIKE